MLTESDLKEEDMATALVLGGQNSTTFIQDLCITAIIPLLIVLLETGSMIQCLIVTTFVSCAS